MCDYNPVMPYLRIGCLLMYSRIGCELTCIRTPYPLHCQFPSASAIYIFMVQLLKHLNISREEIPIFVSCTLQLWNRMLHHNKLHFSCWQITMCVLVNTVGKLLDDDWYSDSNWIVCQLSHFDLNMFNETECVILATLNFDLSLCTEKLRAFIFEVRAIHTLSLRYIEKDYKLSEHVNL